MQHWQTFVFIFSLCLAYFSRISLSDKEVRQIDATKLVNFDRDRDGPFRQLKLELSPTCRRGEIRQMVPIFAGQGQLDQITSIRIQVRWRSPTIGGAEVTKYNHETSDVFDSQTKPTQLELQMISIRQFQSSPGSSTSPTSLSSVISNFSEPINGERKLRCLTLTLTLVKGNEEKGFQMDLNDWHDLNLIVHLKTEKQISHYDDDASTEIETLVEDGSGADEPQTPDVRFSLFEANFCAISLYWHLLRRAEPFSARFIAEFFPQKSAKQDQDISSILLESIRNANKSMLLADKSQKLPKIPLQQHKKHLLEVVKKRMNFLRTRISELLATIAKENIYDKELTFLAPRIHKNLDHLVGYSIVCDLLLSFLAVIQTIQCDHFIGKTLDITGYLTIVKRAIFAAKLKQKWLRDTLTHEFGTKAIKVFNENEQEFTGPFRCLTLQGHVAWTLEIDYVMTRVEDRDRFWLTTKSPKKWSVDENDVADICETVRQSNAKEFFAFKNNFINAQKHKQQTETVDLFIPSSSQTGTSNGYKNDNDADRCEKIESIVNKQFTSVLIRTNINALYSYTDLINTPSPIEFVIPNEVEESRWKMLLLLMLALKGIDRLAMLKYEKGKVQGKEEAEHDAKHQRKRVEPIDSDSNASETPRQPQESYVALKEGLQRKLLELQREFKKMNYGKFLQAQAKALKGVGFQLVDFCFVEFILSEDSGLYSQVLAKEDEFWMNNYKDSDDDDNSSSGSSSPHFLQRNTKTISKSPLSNQQPTSPAARSQSKQVQRSKDRSSQLSPQIGTVDRMQIAEQKPAASASTKDYANRNTQQKASGEMKDDKSPSQMNLNLKILNSKQRLSKTYTPEKSETLNSPLRIKNKRKTRPEKEKNDKITPIDDILAEKFPLISRENSFLPQQKESLERKENLSISSISFSNSALNTPLSSEANQNEVPIKEVDENTKESLQNSAEAPGFENYSSPTDFQTLIPTDPEIHNGKLSSRRNFRRSQRRWKGRDDQPVEVTKTIKNTKQNKILSLTLLSRILITIQMLITSIYFLYSQSNAALKDTNISFNLQANILRPQWNEYVEVVPYMMHTPRSIEKQYTIATRPTAMEQIQAQNLEMQRSSQLCHLGYIQWMRRYGKNLVSRDYLQALGISRTGKLSREEIIGFPFLVDESYSKLIGQRKLHLNEFNYGLVQFGYAPKLDKCVNVEVLAAPNTREFEMSERDLLVLSYLSAFNESKWSDSRIIRQYAGDLDLGVAVQEVAEQSLLEYWEGMTSEERTKERIVEISLEILLAMMEVHEKKIVHGHLTFENFAYFNEKGSGPRICHRASGKSCHRILKICNFPAATWFGKQDELMPIFPTKDAVEYRKFDDILESKALKMKRKFLEERIPHNTLSYFEDTIDFGLGILEGTLLFDDRSKVFRSRLNEPGFECISTIIQKIEAFDRLIPTNHLLRFFCYCESIAYTKKHALPSFSDKPVPKYLQLCPGKTLKELAQLGDETTIQTIFGSSAEADSYLSDTKISIEKSNAAMNRIRRLYFLQHMRTSVLPNQPELINDYKVILSAPPDLVLNLDYSTKKKILNKLSGKKKIRL